MLTRGVALQDKVGERMVGMQKFFAARSCNTWLMERWLGDWHWKPRGMVAWTVWRECYLNAWKAREIDEMMIGSVRA